VLLLLLLLLLLWLRWVSLLAAQLQCCPAAADQGR
jgi:hypothetical protein